MKTKNKNAFRLGVLAIAGLLAMVACTDKWDEHYDSVNTETYEGTLFECLESQSEDLSDFIEILKAVGYDSYLGSDQMMSVWAPVNGSFDKEALLAQIENGEKQKVIDRFIGNHVALYSISQSPNEQSVTLLNDKVITLSGTETAKFGDSEILKSNIACANGIMYVIGAENKYVPTIFESLEDDYAAYLEAHPDVDPETLVSLMTFLKSFDKDSLDESKSVFKELDLNGNRVYIDSVMIRNNTILRSLDALIYEEDSTYWTIVPSVEAYQKRYEEAKALLKYNPSINSANPNLADSLANRNAHLFAMRDLFYNVNANEHYTDSLKSTDYRAYDWEEHVYRGDPFGSDGILGNAEVVECSNGNIYKVNEYPVSIYDQFYKKISRQLEYSIVDNTDDGYTKNCILPIVGESGVYTDKDNKMTPWRALYVNPTTKLVNPQVAFRITGTLSGKYMLKIVTVPYILMNISGFDEIDENSENNLKYKFRVNLSQRNDEGEFIRPASLYVPGTTTRDFESHVFDGTNPLDTIDICEIDLNHCYYGRQDAGIMIQIVSNVTSTNLKKGYTRNMLLQKIILEPVSEGTEESND